MKRAKIYAVTGMVILGLCFSSRSMASAEKVEQALEAAKAWLALVDEGKYRESWETAAGYFKSSLSKERWEQILTTVRKPMGSLVSREISSKNYMKSLPGAPEGEYVVFQFRTSFENKPSGIETVTPMLERDGSWRVSGYYIK